MEPVYSFKSISVYPHHVKQNICGTRAKYRDGKKDTAVKVYTINQESVYLLISNVPAVGGAEELQALCDQYGTVEDFRPLDEYPCEEFTEVYLVKYNLFPAARIAKKHLDDRSFLGSTLHVCYAPEFETISETRLKLQERRKYVAWKTKTGKNNTNAANEHKRNASSSQVQRNQLSNIPSLQPVTYIWAGKEYTEYPVPPLENLPVQNRERITSSSFVPHQVRSNQPLAWNSAGSSASSQSDLRSAPQSQLPYKADSSYQKTISDVRKRVAQVSVPNVRVSLKRRKRL
ncbi:RNA-binding protein 48-like [Argiope bruennichi]|uniref:RNA-binding protein 48-like n=1 Tax=Argiope bruennichi TaxID=94029 RepID=UPI0024946BD5|nr:RNA-binding protein 48-like [Argiope bruennichi]